MDDKFYIQLNMVNIITIFLMWLIVAVLLGFAVSFFGKKTQTAT